MKRKELAEIDDEYSDVDSHVSVSNTPRKEKTLANKVEDEEIFFKPSPSKLIRSRKRRNVADSSDEEEPEESNTQYNFRKRTPVKTVRSMKDKSNYEDYESDVGYSNAEEDSEEIEPCEKSMDDFIVPNYNSNSNNRNISFNDDDDDDDLDVLSVASTEEEQDPLFYRKFELQSQKEKQADPGSTSDWRDSISRSLGRPSGGASSASDYIVHMAVFLSRCILDKQVPQPIHAAEIESFSKLQTKAQSSLESAQWTPAFNDALKSLQVMSYQKIDSHVSRCDGCGRSGRSISRSLTLSGVSYDSQLFWANTLSPSILKADSLSHQTFNLGINCFYRGTLFFLVQHFKIQMMIDLQLKINGMLSEGLNSDHIISQIANDERLHFRYRTKVHALEEFLNSNGKAEIITENILRCYSQLISDTTLLSKAMRDLFSSQLEGVQRLKEDYTVVQNNEIDYYKMWKELDQFDDNMQCLLEDCTIDELRTALRTIPKRKFFKAFGSELIEMFSDFIQSQ